MNKTEKIISEHGVPNYIDDFGEIEFYSKASINGFMKEIAWEAWWSNESWKRDREEQSREDFENWYNKQENL